MTRRPTDPRDDSRRLFLVQALSLGWLVGGVGWSPAAPAQLFGQRPSRLPPNRSVFEYQGDVRINGRPANRHSLIRPTDTITTGSNSYLVAAVGSTAFIVRENSLLELGGGNPLKQALRLVSGKLLGVFGKLAADQSLTLNTPAATIGVRGTGLYAEADADKTYLCTCYGVTDLASAVEPAATERVAARHHDAPRYILAQPDQGRWIVPAPFINHTDLELMTLEALVGREVPFARPRADYEAPRREY